MSKVYVIHWRNPMPEWHRVWSSIPDEGRARVSARDEDAARAVFTNAFPDRLITRVQRWYHDIDEIKQANRAAGFKFFTPGAMQFFRSRVHDTVYGGRYFVTSERDPDGNPRRYTVRKCDTDGDVGTAPGHDFMEYASRDAAHKAAQQLADTMPANLDTMRAFNDPVVSCCERDTADCDCPA